MDYYEVLGIGKDASSQEITKAFRKLVLKWHPDKGATDLNVYERIVEAYRTLSNEKKRKEYDSGLAMRRKALDNHLFDGAIKVPVVPRVGERRVTLSHSFDIKVVKGTNSYNRNVKCSRCADGAMIKDNYIIPCIRCRGKRYISERVYIDNSTKGVLMGKGDLVGLEAGNLIVEESK